VLETFTLETFAGRVNSTFRLAQDSSEPVELELVEANDVGSTPRQTQFSIVFRGPHNPLLAQSIYRIEHDEMGTFDLFLVPIKKDQAGTYYEAIFNRPL
jgi:hypothetical protein